MESKLKTAYLNAERAKQHEEKMVFERMRLEREQAIDDYMERERQKAIEVSDREIMREGR